MSYTALDSGGRMTVLTITAKGQVTLQQDLLKHLGVSPGEKIEADKLPDGRIVVRAIALDGAITNFVGCLAKRRGPKFTIDESSSSPAAAKILAQADLIAVPVSVLCEFAWVLRRGYKKSAADVSDAIRRLMRSVNVTMNRPAVEAGLSALDAGGDFADGVISYEGEWLGAEEFVSFDSKAVSLLQAQGGRARLLS